MHSLISPVWFQIILDRGSHKNGCILSKCGREDSTMVRIQVATESIEEGVVGGCLLSECYDEPQSVFEIVTNIIELMNIP